MRWRRLRLPAKQLAICGLILGLGSPAAAQYFGRNKVRYRAFDFQVLKTAHFDIYFYASEREGVDVAARLAERWHTRFEQLFEHRLTGRQPLILYGSHADFEQTNVIPDELSEGTGGVTEPIRRRIVLPLAGPIDESDHVIGHEIVHAFQFDVGASRDGRPNDAALSRLPLWFVEGMAEYLSLGPVDGNTAMKLRDAMRWDRLPSIRELSSPAYFPYQWGHAVCAYIAGRYGDEVIPRLLRAAAADGSLELALQNVIGINADELSSDWHAAIRSSYAPVLAAAVPIEDTARLVIHAVGLGGDLNIGPALSPDGHSVAFLSSRGLFSTDLYVADAVTGQILRKLTSTASDRHLSSIEFIHSAGTWDPSSERIAMATVVGSRPALTIFDTRTGKRGRDIVLSGLDEALNPSWSPDGHAIAFTAMRRGLTDLFVYNLATATLAQITNDAYADLHPAWAPDNRHIVFASDRFSSNLESLQMGALQLVLVDTESGAMEPIAAFGTGKHISPQWSPDGQALYFIGDPDGVSNVYRLSLATHDIEQVTALDTGVSGITPSSPALSVSSATGRLALSIFDNDKYGIYIRDAAEPAGPIRTLPVNAAELPPTDRRTGALTTLLSDPGQGLPVPQTYQTAPYRPTLSLAGVAQPTAGVGVGQYGVAASGGGALVFADMLGDHLLATAVQINSGVMGSFSAKDIAFETTYFNMVRRWNWGVAGGQAPYLYGGFDSVLAASPTGERLVIDRQFLYRQTQRSGSGILAYAFDRTRRVEFRGGLARTSFDQTVTTTTSSLTTGTTLSETTATQAFAPGLNLVTTAVALVSDRASFGPHGPVQGERYRVEISPNFGSLNFQSVLVDYRRYVMPISFYTIAARVFHYGRYGEGDDARLYPIHINNPALVRGYDSLDYVNECVAAPTSPCQFVDRLIGSRVLVGNLELRFPLLRPFGLARGMYGPVPIEVALFADSGVAWTGRDAPAIFGGTRPGVNSAGVAVRIGFGGFVAELNVTHPFQRPGHGRTFGFALIPGW